MRGNDLLHTGRTTTRFPRRDMERERASGAGPVQSRQLTAEELAEVIRVYGKPLKPLPKRPPKQPWTPRGQGLGIQQKQNEKPGRKGIPEPDKCMILRRIAGGEKINRIEMSLGLPKGSLYIWVRKWKWVGITPEHARSILAQKGETYGSQNQ